VALPVEKPPAEVQEAACCEFQVRIADWPLLIEVGEAERVAVGAACGKALQFLGLVAPFIHTSEPSELPLSLLPPVPVHPVPAHKTQELPT